MRMTAIIATVIAAVIAGAAWALCAAGTDGDFENDEEDKDESN